MAALIPLLLMLGLMWLLLIRPQKQQLQRHRAFLDALQVGDEVMTAGGVIGRVTTLDEREAGLEVAPGMVVRVLKQRLLAVPPPPASPALGLEPSAADEDTP